mmetsp:Transcript_49172/g.73083  ORF Transcript_49172/g.73083 Transcript_49172/m.73083 type:complete len:537 (-) Transcript_49172:151-1761(-)|eukprot:CAMPEP_0195523606 /NCGR_PEP_ID=MMETSP0794_2-20130614/22871_1 /TAXON_ID=515487 /ORGANISM="Stephanopyxis turris, Strain CCMP 815" /LENGTH=536 /DNA_ID=CAMNT_0040653633 /DNA_START=197 /DNA_END=1807 /DNA_ORIENTATION=+
MTTTSSSKCRAMVLSSLFVVLALLPSSDAFVVNVNPAKAQSASTHSRANNIGTAGEFKDVQERKGLSMSSLDGDNDNMDMSQMMESAGKFVSSMAGIALVSSALLFSPLSAHAEDELAAKYGNGKGLDTSLIDQTCLVDKCSLQAKACLADDPSCRKGLTCTAKCMGENTCITGCMARYGDENLDNLLKCTIEDNSCIKIAILEGGADKFGEEPKPPAPTVQNFAMNSMQGSWFKVVGFNPNYDCYSCQRNTFSTPVDARFGNAFGDRLQVDVEFSMPRMMPDGTPPPPTKIKEIVSVGENGYVVGGQAIGFNDYATHETMIFDKANDPKTKFSQLVMNKGKASEMTYARTAHSEGEMFGLKFWENWYVIGENDPGQPEFKFIFYNGKTRQNTYEGAFVYSRNKELDPEAMKKVYKIASDANMNPDQFCKIRNGCFPDETVQDLKKDNGPTGQFRGILASTKISQLLGVEPVAAEGNTLQRTRPIPAMMKTQDADSAKRSWWKEAGDYLEDPHKHFKVMDGLRQDMDWPDYVENQE